MLICHQMPSLSASLNQIPVQKIGKVDIVLFIIEKEKLYGIKYTF